VHRDPVNVVARIKLASAQTSDGRYDEAITNYRTVLALSPMQRGVKSFLGQVLLLHGDAQAALSEFEHESIEAMRLFYLSMAYHALRRNEESDTAIREFEKYDATYQMADARAFRGEVDQAYDSLEKAREVKDPNLVTILQDRFLDGIRDDKRWLPFLRSVGKDPDTLAKIEFKVTLPKEWQAEATTANSGAKR